MNRMLIQEIFLESTFYSFYIVSVCWQRHAFFFFHGKNSLQLIEKQGRPVPQNPNETAA